MILIVLLYILINLLRTETRGNHSEIIGHFLAKNHLCKNNVSLHCISQEIDPKGKVNMHCSRHALIGLLGLLGHCPEAKTHFTVSNCDPI